jgi:hypothetical protein
MLLTSLIRKHMYSYILENNFGPSNQIIVPTGYENVKIYVNIYIKSAVKCFGLNNHHQVACYMYFAKVIIVS